MKSHVSVLVRKCFLCGNTTTRYNDGLALDPKLNDSLERETVCGEGICESCRPEGFYTIAESLDGKTINGRIMALRQEAYDNIFNVSPDNEHGLVLADKEVLDFLENIAKGVSDVQN